MSGTLEYRQFVPDDGDDDLDERIEEHVRATLSMLASAADDPEEYAEEVVVDRRESRHGGGHWVHGALDRDPVAPYLTEQVDPERYEIAGAVPMTVHDPVDYGPDELERHLAHKLADRTAR